MASSVAALPDGFTGKPVHTMSEIDFRRALSNTSYFWALPRAKHDLGRPWYKRPGSHPNPEVKHRITSVSYQPSHENPELPQKH